VQSPAEIVRDESASTFLSEQLGEKRDVAEISGNKTNLKPSEKSVKMLAERGESVSALENEYMQVFASRGKIVRTPPR